MGNKRNQRKKKNAGKKALPKSQKLGRQAEMSTLKPPSILVKSSPKTYPKSVRSTEIERFKATESGLSESA